MFLHIVKFIILEMCNVKKCKNEFNPKIELKLFK